MSNASSKAMIDGMYLMENVRKIKNKISQNFENHLVERVDELEGKNFKLDKEKKDIEFQLSNLNQELNKLIEEHDNILKEKSLISSDNQTLRLFLEYNESKKELQKIQHQEKIRQLEIQKGKYIFYYESFINMVFFI